MKPALDDCRCLWVPYPFPGATLKRFFMNKKSLGICDSTSLHGEITFTHGNGSVVITQVNAQIGVTGAIVIEHKDLAKFVLFLADATKAHEDEDTFKGAELEQ